MMLKMQLWLALIALFGAVGVFPAQAEDNWGRLAAISATIGVNANRVCVGEASRGDIGCASTAPYVDPATGYLGLVTNSPSSTLHVGSTWISSTITLHPSINTGAAASYKTSIYSQFSTNNAFGILVNGYTLISTTGNAYSQIQYGSTDTIRHWFAGGRVVIGGPDLKGIYPSTTLDVKGTVKIANGGEACDADRAGAIKYASAVFSFCNGTAWQTLAEAAGASSGDRITSGTTAVVANTGGTISLTTGGVTTGYLDTSGRLVVPGISVTTAQTSVTSLYASGNVGIGASSPNAKLEVAGQVSATSFYLAPLNKLLSTNSSQFIQVGTAAGAINMSSVGNVLLNIDSDNNGSAHHFSVYNNAVDGTGSLLFRVNESGYSGVGGIVDPSVTLHVSGTLRLADGGEACDADRAGAIKYASSVFSFCNGSAWQTLAEAAGAGGLELDDLSDAATNYTTSYTIFVGSGAGASSKGENVTLVGQQAGQSSSGTYVTAVGNYAALGNLGSFVSAVGYAAYQNTASAVTSLGHVSGYQNTGFGLTAIGYGSGYQNTGLRVLALGYAAGQGNTGNDVVTLGYQAGVNNTIANQFIVKQANINATPLMQGDFATGNLGIGTTSPTAKLQVSGTLKLAGTGSETCDTSAAGQLRMNPATKRIEVCRE